MSDRIISRYLDLNGDGSGAKNANGDYSTVADIFYIQPPATQDYLLTRLIVSIEDTQGMQAEEYGNLGAALTNGITVRVQDDSGTLVDLTDSAPVKTNAKWGALCYDVDLKSWGAGDELILVRWTFSRSGRDVLLRGDRNERLEVVLNDNLTGLISHEFLVQGNLRATLG